MKNMFLFMILLSVFSCSNNSGAEEKAMKVVKDRFDLCHLKDSLGESSITYLWSEYDSKHNSILCFQYGGCAIEYFYHDNDKGGRRDTFIVKNGQPFVDDLKESYRKFTDKEYLSSTLTEKQNRLIEGFPEYIKKQFPNEEDFIDNEINILADNEF